MFKMFKKFKIVKCHYYIWNQNEKCIKISTNIPGFGLSIHEIDVEISEVLGNKMTFAQ